VSAPWSDERVFVALGSNVGDRAAWLDEAVASLRADPDVRVVAVSRWIETAPVGGPPGQGPFLNGALELRTRLAPGELLTRLQRLERLAGRERVVRDGPRTLDLDLLVFGERRAHTPELVLPHPRMHLRLFVLEPLEQLAPELELAAVGRSVSEQRARLEAAHAAP
jgi:2-amino-4-hydroxy-6-hydroxymethyldihydropteridine diphosphokinase